MKPSLAQVKEIRERTGLGLNEVVNAFKECESADQVLGRLHEGGAAIFDKKQARTAGVTTIHSYLHNGKIGAMVKFRCETDFVARSDVFKAFMHDVCMHVAAMPIDPTKTTDPSESYDQALCSVLLTQPFVKDAGKTIREVVADVSRKTGEKVEVSKIVRLVA